MGNCAGNPKTKEDDGPVPVPVPEQQPVTTVEVKQVQVENNAPEIKPEETPVASDEKSLGTLLGENGEKKEEVEAKKEEAKTEEVKTEANEQEKPKTVTVEEAKPEIKEEKPADAVEAQKN